MAYWDDVKQQNPDIGEPHNVHPFGVQPKNEQVCRLTLDATNNGSELHPSVNEIIENPPCSLPRMQHMTAAMSPFGNIAVIDDVDAFLQHRIRPSSMKFTCCRDFRNGRLMCFRCLPLGFSVSSAYQQDTMVAFIRAFRRRLRKKGLPTSGEDPVYHKPWPYTTPQRGHSLTAALGYSDDTALICTSWPAGWFAQLHYLMMKHEWRIAVGFKPGKTDPVAKTATWIGYEFRCKTMEVALHEERLLKMKGKLLPFRQTEGANRPTIADAKHLVGVLQFAANIILVGKAYLGEIRKIITAADANSKFGKAHPDTAFNGSERSKHHADMWFALINTMSIRSACIGIRRTTFPHTAQSDASFSKAIGWCWAQMGHIKFGQWPEAWLDKIGQHSEFAEIFITELECIAILFCARQMFPRCVGLRWEGYSDNMGAVHMLNKLTVRTNRIAPVITEILWLAATYDVEIAYAHVPSHRNILTDAGTRQDTSDFEAHVREFRRAYPREWVAQQEAKFPIRDPARPELLQAIPVAYRDDFDTSVLDLSEMEAVIPEWIATGLITSNDERAAAFVQANETLSSSRSFAKWERQSPTRA